MFRFTAPQNEYFNQVISSPPHFFSRTNTAIYYQIAFESCHRNSSRLLITLTNQKMVLVCRCGVVNCKPCVEGCGANHQENWAEKARLVLLQRYDCPGCRGTLAAIRREQGGREIPKMDELGRSELITLLESLRMATEAAQRLLNAADEEAVHEQTFRDIAAFEKFMKAASENTEKESLSSAALPDENTTTEVSSLTECTEKELNIQDDNTITKVSSLTEPTEELKIEDENAKDEQSNL
jgi:hypothetical protein